MFDKKIKEILREILTLKTLKKKSAMVIKTIEKPLSVSFNIIGGGTEYYSDKIAVVKLTTNNIEPLCQVYFDVVDFDRRVLSVRRVIDSDGYLNLYICIDYDLNSDDISEVQQGHQVIINYDCKIISTADFWFDIEYITNEAPTPGSKNAKSIEEDDKKSDDEEEPKEPIEDKKGDGDE